MRLLTFVVAVAASVLATDLEVTTTNAVSCTRKTVAGDTISVNYRGTLPTVPGHDPEVFDSSYNSNPIEFRLGKGEVIAGFVSVVSFLLILGFDEERPWSGGKSLSSRYLKGVDDCGLEAPSYRDKWDQGLMDMCIGEKRKLVIPPSLAYGSGRAIGSCATDCTLLFDTELMAIKGVDAVEQEPPKEEEKVSTRQRGIDSIILTLVGALILFSAFLACFLLPRLRGRAARYEAIKLQRS
ncbi:hypothetical protein BP5796_07661 [Coleophoma crateriformis]|uniref:peptidylprolyl isomerase n=1 Tax=Coleophoma crateriformis TaxID=565419 RepID=A0A3D8RJJ6_9HELO|nr:hypothetical protein BP5796_07661 [Coleophoma crateriformis]